MRIAETISTFARTGAAWLQRAPAAFAESVRREHRRRKDWIAGWRRLVAASGKARADSVDHDARRLATAMIADAAHLLDLKLCYLLAVRMLAQGDALWPAAGQDATLITRMIVANVRAGHWIESVRLAEHSGALAAFGPDAPLDYDQGLQAALEGESTIDVPLFGKRRRVPNSLLFDIHRAMTRALRWLPRRIVNELYALALIALESLLFVRAPAIVSRGGDTAGLSDNVLVNLYRRRRSGAHRATDDGVARLVLGLKDNEVLYRASTSMISREGMLGFVVGWTWKDDAVPVRARDLFYALLDFHMLSRLNTIEELLAPFTLLRIGGRIVDTALGCLREPPKSGALVIEAKGLLAALPWPALWNGWSHLVEDFEVSVDDGLPISPRERQPHLSALFGTSAAMAEEARVVVADARAAGFPADDPAALTRESLAAALSRMTIVHVAAHMSAHPRDPNRARLQLADGEWVDVAALVGRAGGVELLFLASCESGVVADSEEAPGCDGTRPWRLAGVAAVVSTLWRISDRHATTLVRGFYARLLAGETGAAALAGSQRAMLRGESVIAAAAERFIDLIEQAPRPSPADDPAHPRVWGAFRLTGAAGAVRLPGQAGTGSIPSINP